MLRVPTNAWSLMFTAICRLRRLLACTVAERLAQVKTERGTQPKVIFLQNHGVFVGADSAAEVAAVYAGIISTLKSAYATANVPVALSVSAICAETVQQEAPRLRSLLGTHDKRVVHG